LFAECCCPVRIALEVDPWWNTIEGNQREHSPFDCEDERSWAEGETLTCAWEASTERAEIVYMHSTSSREKDGVSRVQETPPKVRRMNLVTLRPP
jgi:hypothetical protein